jgi:arylsulfatase A-like enzyme
MKLLILLIAFALPSPVAAQNVLVVVLDDVGVDLVSTYGEHPDAAPTPTLDSLAEQGVLFRNAWVTPTCNSTRATVLTGRLPWRHRVSRYAFGELARDEVTIPAILNDYDTAAFGKWHLSGDPTHPNQMGFDHYSGSLNNLYGSYFGYLKTIDGQDVPTMAYATTDTVDDAVAWIGARQGPWFAWVAFNAAHHPWHVPPQHLHSYGEFKPGKDIPRAVRAATEAADRELGRLLAAVDLATTTVFVLGDNGTAGQATIPTSSRAKATVYQAGIRVPLILAGEAVAVPGTEDGSPVSGVDLFATIAEWTGVSPSTADDSISFLRRLAGVRGRSRRVAYSEQFVPTQLLDEAWTDGRWKLVLRHRAGEPSVPELYALPNETDNLWHRRRAFGLQLQRLFSPADMDQDGVPNALDNCVLESNADQPDGDRDGVGDACEPSGPTGRLWVLRPYGPASR